VPFRPHARWSCKCRGRPTIHSSITTLKTCLIQRLQTRTTSRASDPATHRSHPILATSTFATTRGRPAGTTAANDPYALNVNVKDPLVRRSDDWDFPTNKFPNLGWLGRVHRGTPWQTVYLKPELSNRAPGQSGLGARKPIRRRIGNYSSSLPLRRTTMLLAVCCR